MIDSYQIQRIIETDLSEEDIEVYIQDAVDWANGLGITNELVIRYLTAHMIASTRDRPAKSEEAGGAKIVYDGWLGSGLRGTSYGQLAITMDTTGILAQLTDQKKPAWIKAVKS